MPAAVYLFSLCTFAFGLSEFVVAGLVVLESGIASLGDADSATRGSRSSIELNSAANSCQ